MFGIKEEVLADVKSFYEQRSACIRVPVNVSCFLGLNSGLRHCFEVFSFLYNIFVDRVAGEVGKRTKKKGVK